LFEQRKIGHINQEFGLVRGVPYSASVFLAASV